RIADRNHRAKRRLDPVGTQQTIAAQFARRKSKNTRKGTAESFRGFKTRIKLRINHASAIGKRLKPMPQAFLPRHFQKCHSEMTAETATDGRQIKPHPGNVFFAPAPFRIGFERVEKSLDG